MRINQNVAALNSWRHLTTNDGALGKSLERLSSGLRINRAADDAAGLAISEKMRSQVRGIQAAQRNALDGISLIQTAEGALNETHAILQRMRELAVQAASDTSTDDDRAHLQLEVEALLEEVDRIATTTEFNGQALLDSNFVGKQFHIGPNADQVIEVTIGDMQVAALGVDATDIGAQTGANTAIGVIDAAISSVSEERATLGAVQNRLEHTIASLGMAAENLGAAESRIRDVDMALEMTNFTRNQIMLQAGTAMLSHANMKPQAVLQLLG